LRCLENKTKDLVKSDVIVQKRRNVDYHLGVDFTNILRTAFILEDPKSAKNTVKSLVFHELLGSARKMLVKSIKLKVPLEQGVVERR